MSIVAPASPPGAAPVMVSGWCWVPAAAAVSVIPSPLAFTTPRRCTTLALPLDVDVVPGDVEELPAPPPRPAPPDPPLPLDPPPPWGARASAAVGTATSALQRTGTHSS